MSIMVEMFYLVGGQLHSCLLYNYSSNCTYIYVCVCMHKFLYIYTHKYVYVYTLYAFYMYLFHNLEKSQKFFIMFTGILFSLSYIMLQIFFLPCN